jgi:hypothetical protein
LEARLLLIEMAVAEQEQQLSAVVGQQEALKEVVTRLAASLEGANQNSAHADVQELTKQVGLHNSRYERWQPIFSIKHSVVCCLFVMCSN